MKEETKSINRWSLNHKFLSNGQTLNLVDIFIARLTLTCKGYLTINQQDFSMVTVIWLGRQERHYEGKTRLNATLSKRFLCRNLKVEISIMPSYMTRTSTFLYSFRFKIASPHLTFTMNSRKCITSPLRSCFFISSNLASPLENRSSLITDDRREMNIFKILKPNCSYRRAVKPSSFRSSWFNGARNFAVNIALNFNPRNLYLCHKPR